VEVVATRRHGTRVLSLLFLFLFYFVFVVGSWDEEYTELKKVKLYYLFSVFAYKKENKRKEENAFYCVIIFGVLLIYIY
jgi:hypothetical protein